MSTRPFKNAGFAQALMSESASKMEAFGCLRMTEDGRKFRYFKAGEALTAGMMQSMAESTAHHVAETGDAVAVGSMSISLVVGATAVTAGQYLDGYLQIYDGEAACVGHQYRIISHSACGSGGTVVIQLEEPIIYAIIATDTWSLEPNPWSSVTTDASVSKGAAGVTLRGMTNAYYGWIQTGGVVCCLDDSNVALGAGIVKSATSGAVKVQPDGALDASPIGYCICQTGVTTKYSTYFLTID